MLDYQFLFRGKSVETGTWQYGQVYFKDGKVYIVYAPTDLKIEIHPETLGQLTPFTDKNLTKLYVGDIINPLIINLTTTYGLIILYAGTLMVQQIGAEKLTEYLCEMDTTLFEIVGNNSEGFTYE